MSSTWAPWTDEHERLANALDRATGVVVDGGRDLAEDEDDGLDDEQRALADYLDRATKLV